MVNMIFHALLKCNNLMETDITIIPSPPRQLLKLQEPAKKAYCKNNNCIRTDFRFVTAQPNSVPSQMCDTG